MKVVFVLSIVASLVGCVAGVPNLTPEQKSNLSRIEVYKKDNEPNFKYTVLSTISAADCSGPGGSRLYGDEGKAIDILLAKAASLNASAIINVSCGSAPLVNNCWAAKKCNGSAVSKQK